jgi:hypothetical protein
MGVYWFAAERQSGNSGLQPIISLPDLHLPLLCWPQEDFPMTKSKIVLGSILGAAVFAAGVLVGQQAPPPPPVVTVNSFTNPNLAAAQRDILAAYNELVVAQKANNGDMAGHADNAGRFLDQANAEVALAAQAANANKR